MGSFLTLLFHPEDARMRVEALCGDKATSLTHAIIKSTGSSLVQPSEVTLGTVLWKSPCGDSGKRAGNSVPGIIQVGETLLGTSEVALPTQSRGTGTGWARKWKYFVQQRCPGLIFELV